MAILEGTARVLRKGGLSGLTTNAVARVAGVSIGTLYQYFPDKDALCDAIADHADSIFRERLTSVDDVLRRGTLEEAVDALLDAAFSIRRSDPLLVREILRLWARERPDRVLGVLPSIAQATKIALVARRGQLGLHTDADVDRTAFVLTTAVQSVLVSRAIDDRFPLDAVEGDIKRLVLGYLALG
jgi:AcrR family transcriptional regulator